jgi:hypothetical protein
MADYSGDSDDGYVDANDVLVSPEVKAELFAAIAEGNNDRAIDILTSYRTSLLLATFYSEGLWGLFCSASCFLRHLSSLCTQYQTDIWMKFCKISALGEFKDDQDSETRTPFLAATSCGNLVIVRWLLENHPEVATQRDLVRYCR